MTEEPKTIFDLTPGNAPALTDIAVNGEDPANTHVLRKITWQSIRNLFVGQPTANNDFVVGNSSGAWQKKTLAETKGILGSTLIGGVAHKQFWIGSWKPTLTNGCGASQPIEMPTNKNVYDYVPFHKESYEFAYQNVAMPDDYSGGAVYAKFYWMHPATTTNFGVKWGIQGVTIGDNVNLDVSQGEAAYAIDTGGTTNNLYISALSTAITIAGTPAAGKLINWREFRQVDNANDTLAVDAFLLGVMIWYPVV